MLTLRTVFRTQPSGFSTAPKPVPTASTSLVSNVGARNWWTLAGMTAFLLALLCGCDLQTTAAGSTGPAPTKPVVGDGISGKWAARETEGRIRKTRTLELGGDGRFSECYQESSIFTSASKLGPPDLCQYGVWFDLGKAAAIHPELERVTRLQRPDLAHLLGQAHLVELVPQGMDPKQAWAFHPRDGLLVTRVGESLVHWGNSWVYKGGSGRLDSTLWLRPGGDLDQVFLGDDGSAWAWSKGQMAQRSWWSVDANSFLTIYATMDIRGEHVQGMWGLYADKLLLTEFGDSQSYGWEGPAGH